MYLLICSYNAYIYLMNLVNALGNLTTVFFKKSTEWHAAVCLLCKFYNVLLMEENTVQVLQRYAVHLTFLSWCKISNPFSENSAG